MSALHRLRALLLSSLAVCAGAAFANDLPGRVGRIADTDGTVWMRDGDNRDEREWIAARRNRPLTERDHLATDNDGRAELHIGSSTLRLGPATEVEFVELDDERISVAVRRGSVALRVRSDNVADEWLLIADDGRLRPLRAGHYRLDVEPASSFAQAWSGEARFEGQDSALVIAAGQRAEFWRENDGRTHYSWAPEGRDDFGAWALGRDRDEMRYAGSRYVSPEMTGAVELDRYGRWDRHPEYGSIWYPQAVGSGWAPYRDGHWAWVAPWGWTWVDDAPWGFAPFHYGRWVHWHGRWGWAPGAYVARPVYAPALVAWLGGGNVSVGISIGGPTVGWVPLAPFEVYRPYYAYTPRYWQRINPGVRYEPRPVRTGPIMYTNQGVPGGVTVVPSNVLRERAPVARAAIAPRAVDPRALRPVAAPAVVPRVVAEPGGARPLGPQPGWTRGPVVRQRDDDDRRLRQRGDGDRQARQRDDDDDDSRGRPPAPLVRDLREQQVREAQAREAAREQREQARDAAREQREQARESARDERGQARESARDERGQGRETWRERPQPQRVERMRAEPRGAEHVRPVMPAQPAAPIAQPTVPVARPAVPMAQPPVPVARPEVRDLREQQRRAEPPGQPQRELRRGPRDDDGPRGGPPGRERLRERQDAR